MSLSNRDEWLALLWRRMEDDNANELDIHDIEANQADEARDDL